MVDKEYREVLWNEIKIPVIDNEGNLADEPYHPTPEQLAVHDSEARLKLITGGEGSGKSIVTAIEGLLDIPRVKLIWIAGNEYADADKEYDYLVDWMNQLGILAKSGGTVGSPPRWARSINGCYIVTKSVKDYIKIGSESPDLILACEAARMDYIAYLRLRGRVARNRGRIVLSGTLEDSLSWYPEFATRWSAPNPEGAKSFSIPTWANFYKYPGGRDDPEIKKLEAETPHDIFLERYAGQACKPANLVISDFQNTIHVSEDIKFDKTLNVEIAVDPGYGGAYAVLAIQKVKDQIWVIDEIYLQGYVVEQIIDICKNKSWWKKVTGGVIDIAGKQHQADRSNTEVWQDRAGLYLRSQKTNEEAGIDLFRTKLKVNPLVGHATILFNPYCAGIISEMGGGKSPIPLAGAWLRDKNLGRPIDKYNHSCKALIYYLVDLYGYTEKQSESIWGKIFRETSGRRIEPIRR